MEKEIALLDSSVLIYHFRKKDKSKTFFSQLLREYRFLGVSTITEFEIYRGASLEHLEDWNDLFNKFLLYPFDSEISKMAVQIDKGLKKKRKQIDVPDLFIAATARHYKIGIATLNKKHFERVDDLEIISPDNLK